MACSCPVVTSNVSSLPEIGGEAAIYVDPLSVARLLPASKRIRATSKLRRLGLEQAKKFSWEKTPGDFKNLRESLC